MKSLRFYILIFFLNVLWISFHVINIALHSYFSGYVACHPMHTELLTLFAQSPINGYLGVSNLQ